MKKLDQDN